MEQDKDQYLWKKAKERIEFRRHLASYILVNTMLWLLWFFTGGNEEHENLPWPVWPMFGWGIGLAFDYYNTYCDSGRSAVEKEYQRLKEKQS